MTIEGGGPANPRPQRMVTARTIEAPACWVIPPVAKRVRSEGDLCESCYAPGRCVSDKLCWRAERDAINAERGAAA